MRGHGRPIHASDAATKTAYQLDDPKKAAAFAGAKVTVTGTLNAATKTIR